MASNEWAQEQRESAEDRARRCQMQNHLTQVKRGDYYRCQFCKQKSSAALWTDVGETCPLCHRRYDWMSAQDGEE